MNDKKYILDENTEKYQYELAVEFLENHKTDIDIEGPAVYKAINDNEINICLFDDSVDCFVKDHEVEFQFNDGAIVTLKFILYEFESLISGYIHKIPYISIQSLYCDHDVDQECIYDKYFSGYKLNKGNYKFRFIITLYKVKDIGLPFVSLEFKNPKFSFIKYIPSILKLFKNEGLIYNSLFDEFRSTIEKPVDILLKNELYKDEVEELLDYNSKKDL